MARPDSGYTSPWRRGQGERTRRALIAAALSLIAGGKFRAEAREIAALAGIHKSAVTRHFGSLDLLYRVIAREHWPEVVPHLPFALGICDFDNVYARSAVWSVLVGRPKDEATHG